MHHCEAPTARQKDSPYNTNATAPGLSAGRRYENVKNRGRYFVQKVARPWQVTMPPDGLQLWRLFTTL